MTDDVYVKALLVERASKAGNPEAIAAIDVEIERAGGTPPGKPSGKPAGKPAERG